MCAFNPVRLVYATIATTERIGRPTATQPWSVGADRNDDGVAVRRSLLPTALFTVTKNEWTSMGM